jgi:hypothetical protein
MRNAAQHGVQPTCSAARRKRLTPTLDGYKRIAFASKLATISVEVATQDEYTCTGYSQNR